MEGYGTYMSMVAETALENGRVEVHNITCVADCEQMVNPLIVEAQVQSGIVFGLSAALWGDVTIEGGPVQQENYDTLRILRITECARGGTVRHLARQTLAEREDISRGIAAGESARRSRLESVSTALADTLRGEGLSGRSVVAVAARTSVSAAKRDRISVTNRTLH